MPAFKQERDTGALLRVFDDGRELRVMEGITRNGLLTLAHVDAKGPTDTWTFREFADALRVFLLWEVGGVEVYCAACQTVRTYETDPPGPWIRHQPTNRRRLPIYGRHRVIVGWFDYARV